MQGSGFEGRRGQARVEPVALALGGKAGRRQRITPFFEGLLDRLFQQVRVFADSAPLILWQGFFRDDPDVEFAAKEAINFQVNMILWLVAGTLLTLTCILSPIGLLMLLVSSVGNIGLTIYAAVKTAGGERYRYPYTWRPLDTSQAQ